MRFGFTLRFDGRYSSYRNEFHLYSASCYCILLHHEVGNTDYYQRCRPWCILLYGFRVVTDQGGNATAAATVTDTTINAPYAISFPSAINNRFSAPRTTAPDKMFTSIAGGLDSATITFKATGAHAAVPIGWIVIGY